ncbi:MAG: hypothetical protein V4563_17635 [Pseudomonadota bacterium]
MAISANVIFDVRTGGSDTANGGAFDPSVSAGMNADGAATSANTSAPVFTSAAYSFVAGDVGAWLFIQAGTNCFVGWFQIASVAANAATLSAASGAAVFYELSLPSRSTAGFTGIATVASPTSIRWTIDYSQQNTAQVSYTDLANAGAGLTVSSAANPFGKHQVGNMLVVASGTNFTAGNYIIASIGGSNVATVTGAANITTGAGSAGVGGLGGAMASAAKAVGKRTANSKVFVQGGTYTFTSSSSNVAGGVISMTSNNAQDFPGVLAGWSGLRTYDSTGTAPLLDAGAISATMATINGQYTLVRNLVIDCKSNATTTGMAVSGTGNNVSDVWVKNSTVNGFNIASGLAFRIRASGCSGTAAINWTSPYPLSYAEADNNTTTGFVVNVNGCFLNHCISRSNTGALKCGFTITGSANMDGCVAYGNTADGILINVANGYGFIRNTIVEGNGGFGVRAASNAPMVRIENLGDYNNTSGPYSTTTLPPPVNLVSASGSFFVNAAGGNFALNTTANQGALAVATGITVFLTGTTTSYGDIGAAQKAASVLPPGGLLVNPGMSGGMRG